MKTLGAAKAKTQFLALLDEVERKRTPVLVTKNGRPVAQIVPVIDPNEPDPIFGFFQDKGRIVGDITEPLYTEAEYEEFFQRKAKMYESIRVTAKK